MAELIDLLNVLLIPIIAWIARLDRRMSNLEGILINKRQKL